MLCSVNAVLVKVARHKKGEETEEMKQYVAWFLEQHHKQHLGVRIVLIFDFTDAGVTNMVCMYALCCCECEMLTGIDVFDRKHCHYSPLPAIGRGRGI